MEGREREREKKRKKESGRRNEDELTRGRGGVDSLRPFTNPHRPSSASKGGEMRQEDQGKDSSIDRKEERGKRGRDVVEIELARADSISGRGRST